MKRYRTIFSIYVEDMLAERGRLFVWFLLSVLNPLILLLYWNGVYQEHGRGITGWEFSSVSSYYLYLTLASTLISTHIEEAVAYYDVQMGGLTKHLLQPFSYLMKNFLGELPYRLLESVFSIGIILVIGTLWKGSVTFPTSIMQLGLILWTIVMGYFVNFYYKMIIGISALWFTDYHGLNELLEVVSVVLGGFTVPLLYLPDPVRTIALYSPFASMFYTPVLALMGKLTDPTAILMQIIWLFIFMNVYAFLWKKGIKQYSAIGI